MLTTYIIICDILFIGNRNRHPNVQLPLYLSLNRKELKALVLSKRAKKRALAKAQVLGLTLLSHVEC